MLTVRIQEKNHSESIMVLKLKDGEDTRRLNDYILRKKIRFICENILDVY